MTTYSHKKPTDIKKYTDDFVVPNIFESSKVIYKTHMMLCFVLYTEIIYKNYKVLQNCFPEFHRLKFVFRVFQ